MSAPVDSPAYAGTSLTAKHLALTQIIAGYRSALVCFSGGVDSTLLLRVAHDVLGDRCVALTAVSITMAASERAAARELAAGIGARLEVVESHELALAEVLIGTNLDDLGDHRPGLAAANERGARNPLVEAGMTKADVRALSRNLGLPTWDKPQLACLSSRFPYGTEITAERL